MAFAHDLRAFAAKAVEQKETLKTAEATQSALGDLDTVEQMTIPARGCVGRRLQYRGLAA